jgi:hypothetical protein
VRVGTTGAVVGDATPDVDVRVCELDACFDGVREIGTGSGTGAVSGATVDGTDRRGEAGPAGSVGAGRIRK